MYALFLKVPFWQKEYQGPSYQKEARDGTCNKDGNFQWVKYMESRN